MGDRGQVFSALLPPRACVPRERLPRMVMDQLGAISSRGPALLTLDDLHMADPASVPVLIFLSRNIVQVPVMIVIAYDCDVLENAPGGAHPLTYGLRILVREGTFEELRLENLGRLALEKVLEEEFMDPLESSLAGLIWARGEEKPMVAIEEVRLLIQSRQVERRQGRCGGRRLHRSGAARWLLGVHQDQAGPPGAR
jgi:predicted ATPase